ncbi:MAG: endonuclease domain-containing protein [Rhodoglobus sp.]
MRRVPLPEPLDSQPFTVQNAQQAGISLGRLRNSQLDKSIWGVRREGALTSLEEKCRGIANRLRDDAFYCHATAALLYGAPLPFSLELDERVHVGVTSSEPPPHARGITGHHLDLVPHDIQQLNGIRLTSPARTWFDLSSVLPLDDLVAVGDYFIHRDRRLTTRHEITLRLDSLFGKRGIRQARQAVHLLRDHSDSRPESKTRVAFVLGGLPEPEINHAFVDAESGKKIRPDFIFRKERVIIEYQGDYHRTKDQWRKDMTRRARLEAAGWYVMEINADDLRNPEELVARIRSVLFSRR